MRERLRGSQNFGLRFGAKPVNKHLYTLLITGILWAPFLGFSASPPTRAAHAASAVLWVDLESRGGLCSDARTRAEVTAATPWCTLGAAATQVTPGDVVQVRGGTYTEIQRCYSCNDNSVLQIVVSGSPSEWIVFQATPGETVVISGAGGATHGVQAIETWDNSVQPQYVRISGFYVRDFPGNCVAVKDTSDITLQTLDITGCQGGAVELHNTARVAVEASRVYNNPMNGWTSAIDLYLCRDGNVVRGNYIWGNTDEDPRDSEGHGITMDYCLEAGGALIENNVIWENEGWYGHILQRWWDHPEQYLLDEREPPRGYR